MYMLIILEIIEIFFYSQRSIAERLSGKRRTPKEPIPSTPNAPIPPTYAVSLCFIYN